MEKNLASIDCPTLLLIYQVIEHNINTFSKKKSKINANLQRLGSTLGTKIMMKVSNTHSSKTRDLPQIMNLFANEFWQFAFGKPGTDIVSLNANSITFKDLDFDLITRVSGVSSEETRDFLKHVNVFCVAMFEAAFDFLDVSADVKLQKMDQYTILEVSCAKA